MIVAGAAVRGQAELVTVDYVIEVPYEHIGAEQPFALYPSVVHRTVCVSSDVHPAPGTIVAPGSSTRTVVSLSRNV